MIGRTPCRSFKFYKIAALYVWVEFFEKRFYGYKVRKRYMDIKPGIRPGYFTCIFCKETFEGDRRRVCCDDPECQEKQFERVKERSRRSAKRNGQKKKTNNPCIICGRDKGVNKFYCKVCHTRLSNEYGSWEYSTNIRI